MTDVTEKVSNGVSKKAWLLVGIIGVVIILGFIFSNRFDKNENPTPPAQNQTPSLETLTSNEGGVEVAATPINLLASSREWSFRISLTTHSVELGEDLVSISELVLDSGKTVKPVKWEGSPPGGHHRSGVLKFNAESKTSSSVTLKIKNVGGVPVRVFEWKIK